MEENDKCCVSLEQYKRLLAPVNPSRVSKDGKGFSHLEAYDVRAHLNRIFGFLGWSAETMKCDLVFETEIPAGEFKYRSGKTNALPIWTVSYKAQVCLVIHSLKGTANYTEFAAGEATNQPSRADAHDLAMKTAESQALKRCAVNLGDQFGLSLYNEGSVKPVVITTLVEPAGFGGSDAGG